MIWFEHSSYSFGGSLYNHHYPYTTSLNNHSAGGIQISPEAPDAFHMPGSIARIFSNVKDASPNVFARITTIDLNNLTLSGEFWHAD